MGQIHPLFHVAMHLLDLGVVKSMQGLIGHEAVHHIVLMWCQQDFTLHLQTR